MKIVVTIPTYNERENIEETINAIFKTTKRNKYELDILVIDDNSPDKTYELIEEISKNNKNVKLLFREKKEGLGAAYKAGWEYAFNEMNADAIITFDADLSHDPKIMDKMINYYSDGYDYVCGSRYIEGGGIPDEWGFHRKLLSKFSNLFVKMLYFNSPISDFTSGYKLISKDAYSKIKEKIDKHGGYTFAISTNLEPIRENLKIAEVPYKFEDRKYGQSKMGLEYMVNAFIFVVKIRIEDLLKIRFIKVAIAGGIGAMAQLISFGIIFEPLIEDRNILGITEYMQMRFFMFGGNFPFYPRLFVSTFLSIQVGIFFAFIVNNLWAFKDSKLTGILFVKRYIKNQFVVLGAIIIQLIIVQILAMFFGLNDILKYIYQIIGILVGLIWNYYFYKKIIWKVK